MLSFLVSTYFSGERPNMFFLKMLYIAALVYLVCVRLLGVDDGSPAFGAKA